MEASKNNRILIKSLQLIKDRSISDPLFYGFRHPLCFRPILEAISNMILEDCHRFEFMTYADIALTTYMLPLSCTDSAFSASKDAVLFVHTFLCHY